MESRALQYTKLNNTLVYQRELKGADARRLIAGVLTSIKIKQHSSGSF